jgi:hypothetical protein
MGWASPKSPTISVRTVTGQAHSGKTALQFSAQTNAGWAGFGWRWFPWQTKSGTDISGDRALTFWVREVGAHKPQDLIVSLRSGDAFTGQVSVKKYQPRLADGQWHPVRIPLRDLYASTMRSGAKTGFNPRLTQEFDMGTSDARPTTTVLVDDIGFSRT